MIDFADLVSGFKELGLASGNIVMVHSSFKSLGGVKGGPKTVIDAIFDVIGKNGTLVVPTFTMSFCEQFNKTGMGFFDLENTPSEMGIISEMVRKMPDSKRSVNPIYSIVANGRLAEELSSVTDKIVFGKDSIFGKLHMLDAKIMMIGVDYDHSFTFSHYVEQMEGCDYRYLKDFLGVIIANGKRYNDTFKMNVRNLEKKVIAELNTMGKILEEKGVCKIKKIGESTVKLMGCKEAYELTAAEMKKNPHILCRFGNIS